MKSIFLTALFSFFAFAAFAQSANSSARQTVSLQLKDISILEKKHFTDNGIETKNANSLKIESAGQWIITTKKTSSSPKTDQQKGQKNQALSFNTQQQYAELVYTLSKA